jgi:hypothetical protein
MNIITINPICLIISSPLDYLLSIGHIASVLSIIIGTKNNDTTVDAIEPKIKAIPSPPNIGSVDNKRLPKIIATAVIKIGLALVAVAIAIARFLSIPLHIKILEKSISNKELLALIPISEINPISEVAVKKKLLPLNTKEIISVI